MQRARRLALLAVLPVVGTFALTGCRSQPGTAVYIGSTSYSQKYVDDLADQLRKMPSFSTGDSRQTIAQWLILRDLSKRLVADNRWQQPAVDEKTATATIENGLQQAGGQVNTESVRPLIKLYAQLEAYQGAVQEHITPQHATAADYADLYQRAKAAGQVPPNVDEATYTKTVGQQNEQTIQAVLGARKLYADAVKAAPVSLNPKYGPAELALLSNQGAPLIVLPLKAGAGQQPVVPAPAQPQTQAQANG
ncbi:hypothetical protein HC031_11015 [Planosporangium thailandense]|uniref:Lipoprotein n=1 Tax=Planosporangium thailandense TaxID=765197 RepID=A0ABX0XW17_9ACTN|nr:hypothetical protein [Planosporangium thailandense]NJC70236.1 hypothetical protein [Planosporangium thailandense]